MIETKTGFSGTTARLDALDRRLHAKLDRIGRQLNWMAIGVAAMWLVALASLFRG